MTEQPKCDWCGEPCDGTEVYVAAGVAVHADECWDEYADAPSPSKEGTETK